MYKIFSDTLFLGKEVIHLPSCHSTNTVASDLLALGRPEGTLIITDHQTAGRGQRGNTWAAEPEQNLTFSILFRPRFLGLTETFGLNLFVSLALQDWAHGYGLDLAQVKWPNDLYVGNHKMGGILIENTVKGSSLDGAIVGIGLNINQMDFGPLRATSLSQLVGHPHDLRACLERLLPALERRYLQLKRSAWPTLWHDYNRHLMGKDVWQTFQRDGESFEGQISGVTSHGYLEIRERDETVQSYAHGEVQWVFD